MVNEKSLKLPGNYCKAICPGSKKPFKLRKTPVFQRENRSTARRLKEPFAHHKLHRGNNSPALTDQSRPAVSAKCMEIINPFSNQGLSCTCQARNSQKSWYTILNNLSLVKLYLTLILAALWIQSSLRKSRVNLFSLHSCGQKTASGIHLCSFTHVPTKGYTWTRGLLAAQQLILLNEVSG